jgi:hypothetical protein
MTFDIMYFSGPSPGRAPDTVSLNAWDWEFLRQQLIKLDSTGPTEPAIKWRNLGGHDLLPHLCAGVNQDGRQEVFVIGTDREIYHRREVEPGGDWDIWYSLGGEDLTKPVRCGRQRDGRLVLCVRGGDGAIYYRAQETPNGAWANWLPIGGSDVRDFVLGSRRDGRLVIAAVFGDGTLHVATKSSRSIAWGNWRNLGGYALEGSLDLAENLDGRLEVFVVGGDGIVYHIWEASPTRSTGWSGWANFYDPKLPSICDIAAARSEDGKIFVFMMTVERGMFVASQVAPGGGWSPATDFFGSNLLFPAVVSKHGDGRLEVGVVGGDRQLHVRFQVDPNRPENWSNWTAMGGHELQAPIAGHDGGQGRVDYYVVGGNGQLYLGRR